MIDDIKKMVIKHHGGFENATVVEIKQLWDSLSDDTKKQYQNELGKGIKKNADSNRPSAKV